VASLARSPTIEDVTSVRLIKPCVSPNSSTIGATGRCVRLKPQRIRAGSPDAELTSRASSQRQNSPGTGSIDRRLPAACSRVRSARASHHRCTTDQEYGRRLMRVRWRAPISCRHCCRRKEPLHSVCASGHARCAVPPRSLGAGRDNFRDKLRNPDVPVTRSVSYTYISPRGEVAEWLKAMVC
jgi:hypothetical protein